MPNSSSYILLLSVILGSCNPEENKPTIETSEYYCNVQVNNETITKWVEVATYKDTLLTLVMASSTPDDLYWSLNFSEFEMKNQTLTLHKKRFGSDTIMHAVYYGLCCVPPSAPWADVLVYRYSILEEDSLNNQLNVMVDSNSHELFGSFTATFVNDTLPYDVLNMKCDSFYCKWK